MRSGINQQSLHRNSNRIDSNGAGPNFDTPQPRRYQMDASIIKNEASNQFHAQSAISNYQSINQGANQVFGQSRFNQKHY